MLKCILFITLFLFSLVLGAQNLVRNPSFEETDTCYTNCESTTEEQNLNAIGWFNPTLSSPDVYSSCNQPISLPQTEPEQYACLNQFSPFNWRGFQIPHQGSNYIGIAVELVNIQTYNIIPGWREYIASEFISPLENKKYCVSMNLSQASTLYYKYLLNQDNALYSVVNKMGFNITLERPNYITNGSVYLDPSITFTPENDSYFSDTLNWEKVVMPYKANGGERYFTIGNFYNENDIQFEVITNFDLSNPETAYTNADCYLYLDDVEVIEIPALVSSSDTSIYYGSTIQLSTSTPTEGYEWFEGDTLHSLGGGNSISVNPELTTSYYLKANQCKLITWDTVNVTVIPKPIIPVSVSFLNTITSSQFQIHYTGDFKPVLNVELFNSVGQLIQQFQISESTPISLENVSAGIYYCRLSKDGVPVMTGKVVKVN
ncbi:MAG TPA: T9SS type A sorting domain-containing protein [Flavobacteriales bacterium]|nr:T9SS type A sorting domain-containing protein [Flavobacteriales bacterium]HPH82176.1 T9SS type A sorting domain-containing protein [Flavobacteriales bacterium]